MNNNKNIIYRKLFTKAPIIKCSSCGYIGKPKLYQRGFILIDLFLLVIGILPLLIYTFVRKDYWICRECKNKDIKIVVKKYNT